MAKTKKLESLPLTVGTIVSMAKEIESLKSQLAVVRREAQENFETLCEHIPKIVGGGVVILAAPADENDNDYKKVFLGGNVMDD